mmetsp:Transcript_8373/g.25298  ORF Transcript_8373/g.25298 Transcript_8373/m.25298 type:complete len:269 (+) Transcript_8373:554-1360(+)
MVPERPFSSNSTSFTKESSSHSMPAHAHSDSPLNQTPPPGKFSPPEHSSSLLPLPHSSHESSPSVEKYNTTNTYLWINSSSPGHSWSGSTLMIQSNDAPWGVVGSSNNSGGLIRLSSVNISSSLCCSVSPSQVRLASGEGVGGKVSLPGPSSVGAGVGGVGAKVGVGSGVREPDGLAFGRGRRFFLSSFDLDLDRSTDFLDLSLDFLEDLDLCLLDLPALEEEDDDDDERLLFLLSEESERRPPLEERETEVSLWEWPFPFPTLELEE